MHRSRLDLRLRNNQNNQKNNRQNQRVIIMELLESYRSWKIFERFDGIIECRRIYPTQWFIAKTLEHAKQSIDRRELDYERYAPRKIKQLSRDQS